MVDTRDNIAYDDLYEISPARLSNFHRQQLMGVDWQTAAINLDLVDPHTDEYLIMSAPSEDCECSACQNTEWEWTPKDFKPRV